MTRDIISFVAEAGWGSARITPLAGDASSRSYQRLYAEDGSTAVLMDAPPAKGENVRPFVKIAQYLKNLGLSAPEILHQDEENGFLLIEDLGDHLFASEMVAHPALELPLYRAAANVLSHLHSADPPPLTPYDAATTVPLAALAYDWYKFGATGSVNNAEKEHFCEVFGPLVMSLDSDLNVLIQRDYHAENLIWLPDRQGVARVGLLDFQDAMRGHAAYDLVSVLQDARRDVPATVAQKIKAFFIAENGHDPETFDRAYAICGLQRNLRILGVFSRLCLRNGKTHYINLIPRVWGHVETNLAHPALRPLAPVIAAHLPAPTPEIIKRLKGQCGQWAGR